MRRDSVSNGRSPGQLDPRKECRGNNGSVPNAVQIEQWSHKIQKYGNKWRRYEDDLFTSRSPTTLAPPVLARAPPALAENGNKESRVALWAKRQRICIRVSIHQTCIDIRTHKNSGEGFSGSRPDPELIRCCEARPQHTGHSNRFQQFSKIQSRPNGVVLACFRQEASNKERWKWYSRILCRTIIWGSTGLFPHNYSTRSVRWAPLPRGDPASLLISCAPRQPIYTMSQPHAKRWSGEIAVAIAPSKSNRETQKQSLCTSKKKMLTLKGALFKHAFQKLLINLFVDFLLYSKTTMWIRVVDQWMINSCKYWTWNVTPWVAPKILCDKHQSKAKRVLTIIVSTRYCTRWRLALINNLIMISCQSPTDLRNWTCESHWMVQSLNWWTSTMCFRISMSSAKCTRERQMVKYVYVYV